MALILNIETATDVCSVALGNESGLLRFKENNKGKSHAAILTVFIEELLRESKYTTQQLDAVAISMGPGSYTGLRIGTSVAKGICYGADRPLIAVPTLQSMAYGFSQKHEVMKHKEHVHSWLCPMIDARRLEVYTAFFNVNGDFQTNIKAEIINENSFADILNERKVLFFGNGSDKCRDTIKHKNALFYNGFEASAKDMIKLSHDLFEKDEFKDVAYFEPFYLKDFIATVPKKKVLK
jgi:tRNA threonylcarbamoyladenosine biosynthesis protein TsaB